MGCKHAIAALLTYACILLAPVAARAEPQLVGILSIKTRGVSEAAAEQFESEVEEALDGVGMQSIDREALRKRLQGSDYMDGCTFGVCLAKLRAATGVPLVLVADIQGTGSNYGFVITLVDTKTGIPTSQVAQTCAVCTIEEAISTATLTTISVLTGTGDAKTTPVLVANGGSGKAGAHKHASTLSNTGLAFIGVGVVGVLAGAYLVYDDHRDLGVGAASSGAALATGGATMLLLSRSF